MDTSCYFFPPTGAFRNLRYCGRNLQNMPATPERNFARIKEVGSFGKKSWLNLTISWDHIYSYIIMIFQSSLSNLILLAHDSPLHLLHRSAKWSPKLHMAAWIAGIPIPWHPCNTPRGSPYRLPAPLKFFKKPVEAKTSRPWMGCTSTYHIIPYPQKKRLF